MGAVIEDDNERILLVKHRPERGGFWQGKWICPGGELEPGETIGQGIKREVKEETQLDIELLAPLTPFERIARENGEVALHVIYIDYLARRTGGELKPGSDVGEAQWIEKQRLPGITDELHEDTVKLLRLAGII
ncbi:NUDIX domain-containing protein [Chloroflexota bacterium]